MQLHEYEEWLSDNKAQFKKYRELLQLRYDILLNELVLSDDRDLSLLKKGQLRYLTELIDELR